MLTLAGGDNVFADVRRQSVQATSELILAKRPQVIVELRAGEMSEATRRKEIAVWGALSSVPAVRTGRVSLVNDQRTVVPGPRVAEGTEVIARVLHPEAFAKSRSSFPGAAARTAPGRCTRFDPKGSARRRRC
jgi:iron complex transport system substrate-binding protein